MVLVGIDIVEIDRIKRAVQRNSRFTRRVYTEAEVDYCQSRGNPYPSLAVRFAAKEAFRKLHPELTGRIRFKDVEVTIGTEGKPELSLHGEAAKKARLGKLAEIDISLSHSRHHAVAVVIARTEQEVSNSCEGSIGE